METWDAIRARRNVRQFADMPISPQDLDRILEAGRRSPSSKNSQPWDFVVCTDRNQLHELSRTWRYAGHVATSAATVALIAPADDGVEYDLGQATMSMMMAAADLGIGSGHTWVMDQDLARRVLGHPDDRRCAYLLAFGYPAEGPLKPIRNPDRRPFDQVVHRDGW